MNTQTTPATEPADKNGSTINEFIGQFDSAIDTETCQKLIKLFGEADKKKLTHRGKTGPAVDAKRKDSTDLSSTRISQQMHKKYAATIESFFNGLMGAHADYLERYPILKAPKTDPHGVYEFNIQRYYPGGQAYHAWHYESAGLPVADRILAWMTYLNTVEQGGETEFIYQDMAVQPVAGRTLIWPAAFTHTHRGVPSVSDTKYIITGWFRFAR